MKAWWCTGDRELGALKEATYRLPLIRIGVALNCAHHANRGADTYVRKKLETEGSIALIINNRDDTFCAMKILSTSVLSIHVRMRLDNNDFISVIMVAVLREEGTESVFDGRSATDNRRPFL